MLTNCCSLKHIVNINSTLIAKDDVFGLYPLVKTSVSNTIVGCLLYQEGLNFCLIKVQ